MNGNGIYSYINSNGIEGQCKCGQCGNLDIANIKTGDWDPKKFHRYGHYINGKIAVRVICKNCGNDIEDIIISNKPLT